MKLLVIAAIVLVAVGCGEDNFDEGRRYQAEWNWIYRDCVRRNEQEWADYYHRPASVMSDAEAEGISRVCRNYADDEMAR